MLVGHFAASMPQIQASGWPGVIPSTLQILSLPWLQRPSFEEQKPWPANASTVGWRKRLFMDLRRNRVDANRLWEWQRWLLFEVVLWGDPEAPGARERFVAQYEGYLSLAASGKELSKRQSFKLLDWVARWPLRVRWRWPSDTPVPVELHAYGYFDDAEKGRALRATPVGVPGDPWETPMMGPAWWRDATRSGAWKRHVSAIGPISPNATFIEFDLELRDFERGKWEAGDRTGAVSWRRRVRLPVEVARTIDDVMFPVESSEVLAGVSLTMRQAAEQMGKSGVRTSNDPTVADRQWNRLQRYQRGDTAISGTEIFWQATVNLFFPSGSLDVSEFRLEIEQAIIKMNMVVCGLRFDVLRDGTLVAQGSAWGVGGPKGPGSNYAEGDLMYAWEPLQLTWRVPKPSLEEARRSKWTLKAVGDPKVALGFAGSDRYWKGEIEVPVEPAEDRAALAPTP